MNPVDLYVFSGTGNTFLAAQEVCRILQEEGPGAQLWNLEASSAAGVDTGRTLGVAFPVACFATYPLVMNFLNRLPAGNGCGVFLLDTLGGNSGNFPGRLRALFQKKGYTLLGAAEIVMPSNFLGLFSKEETNRQVVEKGVQKAAAFARALLAGTAVWPAAPALGGLWDWSARCSFGSRIMQAFLRPVIRAELCVGCGKCVNYCPAGNIRLAKGRAVMDQHCQFCMRCRGLCPEGAIRLSRTPRYHVEDWPERMNAGNQ